jgi:hypothetical protein
MIGGQEAIAYCLAYNVGNQSNSHLPVLISCLGVTITLTNGVPIETVGQMLEHKSIRSTQIYARVTDTKVSRDIRKLKKLYKGQPLYLADDFI